MALFVLHNVVFKDLIRYPEIEIEEAALTSIVGESGSGKTTLLRLLNGTASATSGEVRYEGRPIEDYDPVALRCEVLLCGQSSYLFEGSVQENFAEFYRYRDLPAPSQDQMRSYLELCAADFDLQADCLTLSGGERQRVFIAICLSFCPKVLLLDEPTSALDDATAHTMMTRLKAFCTTGGITLVVVSHNSALVTEFADALITLAGGHDERAHAVQQAGEARRSAGDQRSPHQGVPDER